MCVDCQLKVLQPSLNPLISLKVLVEDVAGEEPYFTEPLSTSNNKPKEGTAFYLEYKCIGYPIPYVAFFHNRTKIGHDERRRICESVLTRLYQMTQLTTMDAGHCV